MTVERLMTACVVGIFLMAVAMAGVTMSLSLEVSGLVGVMKEQTRANNSAREYVVRTALQRELLLQAGERVADEVERLVPRESPSGGS